MRETPRDSAGRPEGVRPSESERQYSAQDVRQGEIILRTRRRRWIFFGGLVVAVVAALLASAIL